MMPAKWQESVTARDHGKMIATSSTNQKFLIRSGLADEKITRSDPQTTYAGTDTRDVYYHGWDVSREQTPPRDKERRYQMERTFLANKMTDRT